MTGHPANPNEAVVQRAATVATEMADLRDELEQQTARADELDESLEATNHLLRGAQRERGRIIDLLDVDESTPGWFGGFAENLPDLIEEALGAQRSRTVVAVVVAAAVAFAGVVGAIVASVRLFE